MLTVYRVERGAGRKERHKSRTESDWTAGAHNCSDSTADAAMEAAEIARKIKKIEDAAMEAVGKEKELYPYLLYYVTTEYCTFQTMKARGIPCERSYFYEMRRRFYSIIARRIR